MSIFTEGILLRIRSRDARPSDEHQAVRQKIQEAMLAPFIQDMQDFNALALTAALPHQDTRARVELAFEAGELWLRFCDPFTHPNGSPADQKLLRLVGTIPGSTRYRLFNGYVAATQDLEYPQEVRRHLAKILGNVCALPAKPVEATAKPVETPPECGFTFEVDGVYTDNGQPYSTTVTAETAQEAVDAILEGAAHCLNLAATSLKIAAVRRRIEGRTEICCDWK